MLLCEVLQTRRVKIRRGLPRALLMVAFVGAAPVYATAEVHCVACGRADGRGWAGRSEAATLKATAGRVTTATNLGAATATAAADAAAAAAAGPMAETGAATGASAAVGMGPVLIVIHVRGWPHCPAAALFSPALGHIKR